MDSHRWDTFRARAGDIVLASYPKSGSTWTQRILDMLIHQSTAPRPLQDLYPWLDATFFGPVEVVLATLEAQTHRRAVKSHLPFDSLPLYEDVKYLHVARDGRDACFSMHNHEMGLTTAVKQGIADAATRAGRPVSPPPVDAREYYLRWIDEEETSGAAGSNRLPSYFEFEMTFWRERHRPNLLLVHYGDMKSNLEAELRRISEFLDIDTPDPLLKEIARAADFASMKAEGAALLPRIEQRFDRGHERFLNKGTNGRWREVLNADDIARYDALARRRLSASAAAWIERGRLAVGDPRDLPD